MPTQMPPLHVVSLLQDRLQNEKSPSRWQSSQLFRSQGASSGT
jgi:hypothetical protein